MSDAPTTEVPARGLRGIVKDPSTLASTGLLLAVVFAVLAGVLGFAADPGTEGFRGRLLSLTDTVDVGDVALLGIAVALLVLTPDPPGGIRRSSLLSLDAGLGGVITIYGIVRAIALVTQEGSGFLRSSAFIATIGVAVAAATVGFYAARESFLADARR
jgi:hypothetical protein